jgi:hypothetical protein
MLLSVKMGSKKALFSLHSPISRWLQHIVDQQLDSENGPDLEVPLKALYHFCRDSTNLARAFWLATVCRDAVAQAAKQKEEKTYGKISSTEAGKYTLQFLVILDGCCVAYTRLTAFTAFTMIIQSASGTSYYDNFESVCWYLSV